MRKNGKKLLSLVLALILVVGMLPTTALAAEPTSGTCGENVTWKLENGTLTISGTGNMEDYDSISTYAPWTNLRKAITAVTINKGITSIGSTAFYGCSNLTSVTVADSVTTIRGLAFGGCSELSSVEIPHNVTNIGNQAFWGCSSLTNVSIPNSVTQIGNQAFASSGLTNVTIPNSVTSIGDGAFDCCTNLKNVSISEGITRISDQAFRNCSGLTRVSIPSNVKTICSEAFMRCSGLTSVTIPSNVTRIENDAFAECNGLASVTILSNNTRGTFLFGPSFVDCLGLRDIYYFGSETDWAEISYMFDSNSLTNATIHYNSTGPDAPGGKGLGWNDKDAQTLEVGKTLTLTVQMADDSAVDASKLTWTLSPALGTAEIVDQGQQDEKTAYVTLKGIAPGKVTLHGTLAVGESILNYPTVSQEITVIGQENISFAMNSYSATIGDTIGITFRVPDPNGLTKDNVTFTSSNDSIARVVGIADFFDLGELGFSYTVNIKCLKEGNTTITANALDGRSADCKVIVKESNPIVDSKIVVFSTEKSLTVKTGRTMNLVFGKVVNDHPVKNWDHMAVVVSDPTVISLSEYETDEYGYAHTTVTGKKQGATYVTISDTETKENIIILITVRDAFVGSYSYAIDTMPSFYPDNIWENGIQTNIYNLNGLFVNNYTCVKNGRFYDVSFDAYNYMFTAGAIDIYDADGNWIDCEKISKYETPSGIWDILEGDYSIITDFMTYEMAAASKHSSISFNVPDGGYFTISNNFAESPGVFLFNTCDIVFNAALLKAAGDVDKGDVQLSVFSDLVKNQIKEDPTVRKAFMEMFKGTAKSEIRAIAKNMVKNQKELAYSGLSKLFENLLDSLDISWKHLFQTATGMGESLFETLAGPAGVALKGCFTLSSGTSQVMQANQIAASVDEPYATVYSSIEEGYIAPNGVIVNTNGNVDAEAQLNVFRISNDDTIESYLNGNGGEELKKYELYNICFVKNNQLVQPNGKVTVRIPIPDGMKSDTCTVYRQEENKTWTVITAHKEGNYLVFETDHFSLYAIVGSSAGLEISSLPNKMVYTVDETLNTDGLTLNLDGVTISSGFICDPVVFSGVGTQKITVHYGHSSTEFNVTVQGNLSTFTDVPTGIWYYDAVYWAVEQGITAGTGTNPPTFSPERTCTETEILTFLWRANGKPDSAAQLPFTPKNSWAEDALRWAYEKDMIGATFNESTPCTRASTAKFIWKAAGAPSASGSTFTDVPTGADYAQAVAWAVEHGITQGTGNGAFSPNKTCTRAEIVTFLYRDRADET